VAIGPAPAVDSYLSTTRILEAVRTSEADAVHPGYGFLSENASFAAACEKAGIVFVGPPSSVIAQMGTKIAARRLMQMRGVPAVPGDVPHDQSDDGIRRAIERVSTPVLIKASAGGGGGASRASTRSATASKPFRPRAVKPSRRSATARSTSRSSSSSPATRSADLRDNYDQSCTWWSANARRSGGIRK